MKKSSIPDEPQVRRILKAQSRLERLRMRFAMRCKRRLWLAAVSSTHAAQRLFDVLISLLALILAAPLMAVIALLIRRDEGPVFFKQRRIGFNGRDFEMLKFRATAFTAIGRFIRKTALDELPQFFNVLRGDMSIVGSLPSLPREAALYSRAGCGRLHARPGITCLWHVGRNNIGLGEQAS